MGKRASRRSTDLTRALVAGRAAYVSKVWLTVVVVVDNRKAVGEGGERGGVDVTGELCRNID